MRYSKWLLAVEPLLILVLAGLAVRLLLGVMGYDGSALESALFDGQAPDWLKATSFEVVRQAPKWALLLGIAVWIARSRGFDLLAPFVDATRLFTRPQEILLGVSCGALLLPLATIPRWYHYEVEAIGQVPPIWDLVYGSEWSMPFWVFMAVASFVLVPIVEELFFRGYVLGSLASRFSPGLAILLSALIFQAAHLQYVAWDAFAIYNSIGVVVFSVVAAYLVYRSNSLVPAIVMHAYGNVPRPLSWSIYELALLLPAAWIVMRLLKGSSASRHLES